MMDDNAQFAPHSVEAEEAVLGSVLIDADLLADMAFLKPEDFFIVRHQWIWSAFMALRDRGEAIDYLTVLDTLRTANQLDQLGGAAYITALLNRTPSTLNAVTYAHIVHRAALRRGLLGAASKIAQLAHDQEHDITGIVGLAEQALFAVTEAGLSDGITGLKEESAADYDYVEELRLSDAPYTGLPTGFKDMDDLLGGLQNDDLIILAGRPGMGKTSMALTMARNIARDGVPVGLFSLEMSKRQLTQRFKAMASGISTQAIRSGKLSDEDWSKYTTATGTVAEWPIYMDDVPNLTPSELRAKAKRMAQRHGAQLIIVDYLQLMTSDGENRNQQVSVISRTCKQIARELNIPVLALAQLSRAVESRADKRPLLSDLRDSGSIEQDADVVMFLYRDEYYNEDTQRPNQADVLVSKHRNGPTGTITLYFRKELTEFGNLLREKIDLASYGGNGTHASKTGGEA